MAADKGMPLIYLQITGETGVRERSGAGAACRPPPGAAATIAGILPADFLQIQAGAIAPLSLGLYRTPARAHASCREMTPVGPP
jgi:hypothetical protein